MHSAGIVLTSNAEWIRGWLLFVFFVFAEDLQHEPLSGSVGDIGSEQKA
jgi:hypothetical protein